MRRYLMNKPRFICNHRKYNGNCKSCRAKKQRDYKKKLKMDLYVYRSSDDFTTAREYGAFKKI